MAIGGIQSTLIHTAPAAKISSAYLDPRDTNQDGFVSPAEARAYALKHPFADALSRMKAELASAPKPVIAQVNPYDGKGGLARGWSGGQWVDMYG
jgi:hypothetical protein